MVHRFHGVLAQGPQPRTVFLGTLLFGLPLTVMAATSEQLAMGMLALSLIAILLVVAHRWLLSWRILLAGIVLVIMLVPIRRYSLPGALPFELEPYRVAVAVIVLGWVGSLLVEPSSRLRRTGLEAPIVAILVVVGLSVAANVGRIAALGVQAEVLKDVTFLASFVCVVYLTASVVRTSADRDTVLKVLVGGGIFLAITAMIESRVGYNVFDHLHEVVPMLDQATAPLSERLDARGGRQRAYATAQHSIALGAALALLAPFAIYLAFRTGRAFWWLGCGILVMGALATVSRTAVLILVVEVVVLALLRPELIRRFWPLALPLLIAIHLAMPGTIGAFKSTFFPTGGLIAEQKGGAGTYGSGRIADLGPGIAEFLRTPVVGQGYGSRVTERSNPKVNASILDNQWLALTLQTGAAGLFAFAWLILRAVRVLGRRARREEAESGWLPAAFTAAIAAFGVSMFSYDTFSFIQVTFLLFILFGLAAPELRMPLPRRLPATERSQRRGAPHPALRSV